MATLSDDNDGRKNPRITPTFKAQLIIAREKYNARRPALNDAYTSQLQLLTFFIFHAVYSQRESFDKRNLAAENVCTNIFLTRQPISTILVCQ